MITTEIKAKLSRISNIMDGLEPDSMEYQTYSDIRKEMEQALTLLSEAKSQVKLHVAEDATCESCQ